MIVVAARHYARVIVVVVCARSHIGRQSGVTLVALQGQRNQAKTNDGRGRKTQVVYCAGSSISGGWRFVSGCWSAMVMK